MDGIEGLDSGMFKTNIRQTTEHEDIGSRALAKERCKL